MYALASLNVQLCAFLDCMLVSYSNRGFIAFHNGLKSRRKWQVDVGYVKSNRCPSRVTAGVAHWLRFILMSTLDILLTISNFENYTQLPLDRVLVGCSRLLVDCYVRVRC